MSRLKKQERQKQLQEKLNITPFLTDEELATHFNVSVPTIRLDRLELGIPELRERIRNEWRVETCFEGLRYFQLKRWKLLQQTVDGAVDPAYPAYKKVVTSAFEYFPLPQGEIDKAHGVLVQDPNYQ